jgi:hypothetical protein
LQAAIVSVKSWSILSSPGTLTWRIEPTTLPHPKHCSMRFLRHAFARAGDVGQHLRGDVALGRAIGLAGLHVDHQAVPVVVLPSLRRMLL